ncbi:MAG: DNA repair exonuclease [Desulfatiglans sp.]|nr:DNA repair exonuclease [Thermodesulfobacteriota bacterium]MEE4352975.1 DNA repair exonuclease [Desulfatiglans sp.]
MFRFLHAADIHLDSPLHKLEGYEGAPVDELRQATRRAFENLVETAIREPVAFVLISGDLYDGDWRDYNTGLYFVSQMNRLKGAGIPVYLVSGNHDAASKISKALRLPENVHLFPSKEPATHTIEELGVAVHGRSFATPAVKEDLSIQYPSALRGYFNIGMLHTCATGHEGHEPYAPCTLEGLQSKGYDYWALGHVHQHQILADDPPVLFPGNTQGRHIRETGPKGCVIVSVEENGRTNWEFRPLDVIRWVLIHMDVSNAHTGYEVVDLFHDHLEKALHKNQGLPLVTRVVIKGNTDAHPELASHLEQWTNEIRSVAADMSGASVWVEKVKFSTSPPLSHKDRVLSDGAIGELVHLFEELRLNPDCLHDLALELEDLGRKMPTELKEDPEGILLNDPDWLESILDQVQPMLLERLIRKRDPE